MGEALLARTHGAIRARSASGERPDAVLAKVEYLGRFGVQLVGEILRIESVGEQCCVLPENLINYVIVVEVEGGDGNRILRFAPAQRVSRKSYDIANDHVLLTELADQHRGPVAHEN